MGHKTVEGKAKSKRQTPEALGFVTVMVLPPKGHRRMERRDLKWWEDVKQAMGLK